MFFKWRVSVLPLLAGLPLGRSQGLKENSSEPPGDRQELAPVSTAWPRLLFLITSHSRPLYVLQPGPTNVHPSFIGTPFIADP